MQTWMYWDQFKHLSCSTESSTQPRAGNRYRQQSPCRPRLSHPPSIRNAGWFSGRGKSQTEIWNAQKPECSFGSVFSGQDHSPRLLQVGAELIQKPRSQFIVDQASVTGQSDGHQLLGAQSLIVLAQPQLRPGGPHGQDARLRRVDDGAEATDTKHPQVRYAAAGTGEDVTERGENPLAIISWAQQGKNT